MEKLYTSHHFSSRCFYIAKTNKCLIRVILYIILTANTITFFSFSYVQAQALQLGSGYNSHSLGIAADGKGYSWGAGNYGQLGNSKSGIDATGVFRFYIATLPNDISLNGSINGKSIRTIAAGRSHTLALDVDNSLHAWGYNVEGQLGVGASIIYSNIPVPVKNDVKAIAAGAHHTLILSMDGKVWAWGRGSSGQLGDGLSTSSVVPVLVSALSDKNIIAVAASNTHSLALSDDGTIYAWGNGVSGKLGNGSTAPSPIPAPVQFLQAPSSKIVEIAAGGNHSLARTVDGSVYAWGNGTEGQLGNGIFRSAERKAKIVTGLPTIRAIATGNSHSLALDISGKVWAWGAGGRGQLGYGDIVSKAYPIMIDLRGSASSDIIAIGAGSHHSLAITSDGTTWAWGEGSEGQLGQGSNSTDLNEGGDAVFPLMVKSPNGTGTLILGPSCNVLESPLAIKSPVTDTNLIGDPVTTVPMGLNLPSTYEVTNPQAGVTYTWSISHNVNGLETYIILPVVGTQISVDWSGVEVKVYKVKVTASLPGCTSTKIEEAYVAVYDPNAGFVTGGGWITSPEGAYRPLQVNGEYTTEYMSPAGKANFGFVSKYKKGSNIVDGNTEFHFNNGNLRFRSSAHTPATLVISGCKATYRGEGNIEGSDFIYKFMVAAVDGQINGGGNIDKFRIKITEKESGKIVYDNLMNKDENYDLNDPAIALSTVLGGGSIVIHQPNLKTTSRSSFTAIEAEHDLNAKFYNYPNSFSERTTLALMLDTVEEFSIELYDLKGALVQKVGEGVAEAGKLYEFELNGRNLVEGIYLARLKSGSMTQTRKLVLKR